MGFDQPSESGSVLSAFLPDCEVGPGDLLIRGNNMFLKYWKKQQETAESFMSGGWFKTGTGTESFWQTSDSETVTASSTLQDGNLGMKARL